MKPRLATLLALVFVFAFTNISWASILIVAALSNAQAGPTPPVVPTTSTGEPRPASSGSAVLEINDEMTGHAYVARCRGERTVCVAALPPCG